MTSSREALTAFTDAAASAVAREIASLRREAVREREVREAQFVARMAELETRIASVAEIERRLADRVATLKDGEPGRSLTVDDVAPLIDAAVDRAVSALPAPADGQDGKSVTVADVEPLIVASVAEAVAAIKLPDVGAMVRSAVEALPPPPAGKDGRDGADGKSVTTEELAPMVAEVVQRAVAALPVPENGNDGADGRDGKDADPEVIRQMVNEAVAALPPAKVGAPGEKGDKGDTGERGADGGSVTVADVEPMLRELVSAIPVPKDGEPGERGPEGPMGKLPVVKAWEDRVYYEGEVCSFDGSAYQASRATGKAPPHAHWTCIVAKGRDGLDARSPQVRGLWAEDAEYEHLDVVALNGASFIAKRDNPGECPGDGWQLMAMQGKPGKPGPKGDNGMGLRGLAGPAVERLAVSDDGMLTLHNADGTTAECDLYPLLSKIGG